MSRTVVLLTNDDGVDAPGLRILAGAVRDGGFDVVVAAPHREASGMSAAMTAVVEQGRVVVEGVVLAGLAGVPVFAVEAAPAYITVLGMLGVFGTVPDVVVSGINRGANAGRALLHSGTVGAALTAANHGVPAMAVSLDVRGTARADAASGGAGLSAVNAVDDEARHWGTAASMACRMLPWLAQAPPGTVLNINSPDRPLSGVTGLRRATLAPFGQVQMAVAETGTGYVRTVVEDDGAADVPGSDISLLAAGAATVTPIGAPRELTTCVLPGDLVSDG